MKRMTEEAQAAIKELEDRRGRLTPEQVVEAARDKDSPLHQFFDWDDNAAAEKWRIEQARELLKRVKIEVVYCEKTIRTVGYVRDPGREAEEGGYVATLTVKTLDAKALMLAELGQIAALVERARRLACVKAGELPGCADRLAELGRAVKRLEATI